MSLILNGFQLAGSIFRNNLTRKVISERFLHSSFIRFDEETTVRVPPARDRSQIISVETSIEYLQSEAYKECYGNSPVWTLYRRNFKGQIPPRKTRRTCIRNKVVTTGSPCPICRDEYLILDYRNIELLKQFIAENSGEVINYTKTGLCQNAHTKLLVAILKAKDYGLLTFGVPYRYYNYSEWKGPKSVDQQ
ncbi:mitochondrial ribosomal protein S18B [Halictus rubicundus]|uniref:mitochondrial ribosomal protein S18B n=1 Tax=Halictus rubicundus TaxID=77578 RepID=UPI004036DB44